MDPIEPMRAVHAVTVPVNRRARILGRIWVIYFSSALIIGLVADLRFDVDSWWLGAIFAMVWFAFWLGWELNEFLSGTPRRNAATNITTVSRNPVARRDGEP